ncbi:MAG: universal stress protein [Deltaproteobacteria bacterium]|uniref:Universal stress protein n=1 Tax=Candidatus Zymogenus saltonus TaxID=2844893 RepID=A0A9D8KEQ5_9DELT|nr:universal stress protein [Candidatus Zymogenus saltonus]
MLPVKKILCPVDFSEPSYEALKVAEEISTHFSSELNIVHVVREISSSLYGPEFSDFDVDSYQEELEESAKNKLSEVVKERLPMDLSVKQITLKGKAADQIVNLSDKDDIDLIVIATHGQTGWRHFVFGSVTEKVVRLARCPVLTIHAPREEGD